MTKLLGMVAVGRSVLRGSTRLALAVHVVAPGAEQCLVGQFLSRRSRGCRCSTVWTLAWIDRILCHIVNFDAVTGRGVKGLLPTCQCAGRCCLLLLNGQSPGGQMAAGSAGLATAARKGGIICCHDLSERCTLSVLVIYLGTQMAGNARWQTG